MLDLVFGRHLTFETPLDYEEITRRLQQEIARPTWFSFTEKRGLFEGHFADNRFRMIRYVNSRNKPGTVALGEVTRNGAGTRVNVRLRMHRGTLVLCVVLLLVAIGLTSLVLPSALAAGSVTQALFIPALLTLLYVTFAMVSRVEAEKVTALLSRLFETEPRRHG
jgi:hypothetical protein